MNKGVVVIEGHVQGLANTRSLGRAGIPVIVIDKENCVARYSKYCKKYFKCPDYQSDNFITFLINLHQSEDLQDWLLLPSNDHAVYNIAKNKDVLSTKYKVITEDLSTIEKIYNKRTLLQIAEAIGVSIPATVMPTDSNPSDVDLRYPLLIKGNTGLSFYKRFKVKAVKIMNNQELRSIWQTKLHNIEPTEYFIQEIIPQGTNTVSVTVFAEKGVIHTYWMGEKIREHPIQFGTATCSRSVFIPELLEPTKLLMESLKYTGVCEIEFLKDSRDNKYKLIEINARTWLWVGLAIKCGIDYPKIIYRYMNYGELPKQINYAHDIIWINIFTDIVYSMISLTKGSIKLRDVWLTYCRFIEATWDKKDREPFFKYAQFIGRFFRAR